VLSASVLGTLFPRKIVICKGTRKLSRYAEKTIVI